MKRQASYMVGIDEVGRGSLAGPVTVAAVILTKQKDFPGVKDSKTLSEKQRNRWFRAIKKDPTINYATASVYPKTIDRINITEAANRAATEAFRKLANRFSTKKPLRVYLDGGLYLQNPKIPNLYEAKTIIKGDEKINAIKLASIVAKVRRDGYMRRLHRKYPYFGFKVHKGYGTKAHFAAIRKYGPTKHHRLTFIDKSRR